MWWQLAFLFFISAVSFSDCGLLSLIKRQRRQQYCCYGNVQTCCYDTGVDTIDPAAEQYWRQPVTLGVFINPEFDTAVFSKRTDTPVHPGGGSGSGSGSGAYFFSDGAKRDKVPKKPKKINRPKKLKHALNSKRNKIEMAKKSELTAKAATVEVEGEEERSKVHNTVTCQGQKEWLQCPMYRLIKINSAFWGRDDSSTCSRSAITHGLKTEKMCAQDESNTMSKIQNSCDGESACELVASPVYFDRTDCPETYKFLRVNWECQHSESRIKEEEPTKKSEEPHKTSGTL